ncbi:alpha/beta hydrolase [Sphingomonas sp. MG17]|uniref:Alpha/beta hydrolase n=1 Tax=Sphingomonas tagetis TaxID=2949092 RepID=A0A9X2KKJ6_9SPHN|nr:alpha/beta hydrolase fold domain-containing protein [Sphingomonas tagetis]MCP3730584.1 alpha/beta hydrolase [Sphingomonas tagetis]
MTTAADYPPLEFGPVAVPMPGSVSDAARAYLATPRAASSGPLPALDDKPGWRAFSAAANARIALLEEMVVSACAVDVERTTINGARAAIVRPKNPDPRFEGRVLMNIHGGAYILCEGMIMEAAVIANAGATVVAVDYRVAPDHPFPANIEDSAAVYRGLLERHAPARIGIYGTSAGGTFTLTTSLYLRQLGLPLPGVLGVLTPQHDLSGTAGDSFFALDGLDLALSGSRAGALDMAHLFANGHDIADPLISPIFGDYAGFPPTYFLTGTRDMLLSATSLLHRRLHNAGVKTELHVFEAMPHGFNVQVQLPEAQESIQDLLRFFDENLAKG